MIKSGPQFVAVILTIASLCAFPLSVRAAEAATRSTLETGYDELRTGMLSRTAAIRRDRRLHGCGHCRLSAYQALQAERSIVNHLYLALQEEKTRVESAALDMARRHDPGDQRLILAKAAYGSAKAAFDTWLSAIRFGLGSGEAHDRIYRDYLLKEAVPYAAEFLALTDGAPPSPCPSGSLHGFTDADLRPELEAWQASYDAADGHGRLAMRSILESLAWAPFPKPNAP